MSRNTEAAQRIVIPLIEMSAGGAGRIRRRSLEHLSCMGHCAPSVMQTLLEISGLDAPALVTSCGGLPGGIGNGGEECGGVTAPLMLLGLRHAREPLDRGVPVVVHKGHGLLRRFTRGHGTVLCREIRRNSRVPLRCVGVVRHAPEEYIEVLNDPAPDAIGDESPGRRSAGCTPTSSIAGSIARRVSSRWVRRSGRSNGAVSGSCA